MYPWLLSVSCCVVGDGQCHRKHMTERMANIDIVCHVDHQS